MPAPTSPTTKISALRPKPNQKAQQWLGEYINSPKYKERLGAFYKYPDYIQQQRANMVKGVTIRENTGTASGYYTNGNEVAISPLQIQSLKATRDEVEAHEVSHAINSNRDNKASALSAPEAKFILERNKNINSGTIERFNNISKRSGQPLSKLMDGSLHDVNPSENHSDINALRFLMRKRGIYDAGKDNLTPEVLQKAKKDAVIKRSFILKRLNESFDDKGLLEIMNKVATNTNSKKSNTA